MTLKARDRLDSMDRRLLERAQDDFPLTVRPWKGLGNDLGVTEKEVMRRLNRLSRLGLIRRIGPALDAKRLGLASTLVAMKVPEKRIQRVANVIRKCGNVSHCYEREHEYNLWFTMTAGDELELKRTLEEIRRAAHVAENDMLNLPATRIFKIDVRFQLT
jgi:DNA-binding Lrp family transcriptional regulator